MTITLRHLETIELPSKIIGSYACQVSENGYISVATFSALYIYQICPLKTGTTPSLFTKKFTITPSNFVLSGSVEININTFLYRLPQIDFYEAVLNTELSAKLNGGSSVEQKIIHSLWSPAIIDDYDCVLAVLSNTGCIEIISKVFNTTYEEYVSIFNLTEKYTQICRDTWNNDIPTSLDQYNELKYRIKEILPTAFTWSGIINNNYCVLIVGHACGNISFWKVNTVKLRYLEASDITFINVVNVHLNNISSIRWISLNDNNALLFVGYNEGQVICLKITNKNQIVVNGELNLWTEADQIRVKDIKFLSYLHNCYLIFVKGNDLMIILINEDGSITDTAIFHAGNILITGTEIIGQNKILIACLTGAFKEVVLNCVNSKVNLEWKHFYVNINWYINQSLNLTISCNKSLLFFLTGPCKTADTKDDKDSSHLVIFINSAIDPLEILSNNPTKSLKNYWDCLEAFRCQSLIDKQVSMKAIRNENHYDNYSLYELKLLLWISKLSETVYEQTGNINLTIKSYDDIYQILNIKMTVNRIALLLKQYDKQNNLTEFEMHNIFILTTYLKQIVIEDLIVKLELSENMVDGLLNIFSKANTVKYLSLPNCLYCGEKLLGVNCLPPHFDMRCSISLMQIEDCPNYKCCMCESVVHTKIEKEFNTIMCPYCDIPLRKRT